MVHWEQLERILPLVAKPGRYTGNELNIIRKDWAKTPMKFALAFPDIYDVGSGHLGFKILYSLLNGRGDTLAERVYAPWVDMEEQLRKHGIPLFSLESRRGLGEFDLVGFTLQYELSYTNILNMLDLGGIPLLAQDRDNHHPFVVGGGPCVFNPEPLAEFFDLFVIGDGEEVVMELMDCYSSWQTDTGVQGQREQFLLKAAEIPGVYVPAFYKVTYLNSGIIEQIEPVQDTVPAKVTKRVVQDLDSTFYPKEFVVPYIETVHDRIMLEVMRGCTRGCRFCQAGMIYRPSRERNRSTLLEQARLLTASTGYEEISLASLSTSDYSDIRNLIQNLMAGYGDCGIAISLPSLRVDTFSVGLADEIQNQRRTSLTFAPEAGSQRLRDVINKNVTEADLFSAAEAAFKAGWDTIKLYFMIGLPSETMDDVAGISELVQQVLRLGRQIRAKDGKAGRVRVNVSVGSFVPKSHTPFQWAAQMSGDELKKRQQFLRNQFRDRSISFSWTDVEQSLLEATIARGDRRIGKAILHAWQNGAKFDPWAEHFNWQLWKDAFSATGIKPAFYSLRERDLGETLPWDHIQSGVSKGFLRHEWELAHKGITTPDCRFECSDCGLCPELSVANVLSGGKDHDKD
ncbi:MAG: TIGR03960 family B12-binding radical SAM protein [Firmicutes bacterium]|nr:TIGR03960 family B12-binding radical SAM protein [Bacillota bacterium]